MIYRSNLSAPDLQRHFRHAHCRVMGHSIGHDVLSDWADRRPDDPVFGLYKNCGFWTHDEAAILYQVAAQFPGLWLDIGSHTGWTTAHIAAAGRKVVAVDNMYAVPEFRLRARENLAACGFGDQVQLWPGTSAEFFAEGEPGPFAGIVIDGAHDKPVPLNDAASASGLLEPRGVILMHDAIGEPVQQGVRYLISQGFQHRVYYTPHVVACLWRGEFTAPEHRPDPRVERSVKGLYCV